MSRRRIWLIIIGILMAGVSATWEMEKFVSSHGVNPAAVVGFEADAMQPDAGNSGNPYMTENRMKVAENNPAAQNAPAPACGPADNGPRRNPRFPGRRRSRTRRSSAPREWRERCFR